MKLLISSFITTRKKQCLPHGKIYLLSLDAWQRYICFDSLASKLWLFRSWRNWYFCSFCSFNQKCWLMITQAVIMSAARSAIVHECLKTYQHVANWFHVLSRIYAFIRMLTVSIHDVWIFPVTYKSIHIKATRCSFSTPYYHKVHILILMDISKWSF